MISHLVVGVGVVDSIEQLVFETGDFLLRVRTCNQREVYQSPACIFKADCIKHVPYVSTPSCLPSYFADRIRKRALAVYLQSRERSINRRHVYTKQTASKIYQSPACIHTDSIHITCIHKAQAVPETVYKTTRRSSVVFAVAKHTSKVPDKNIRNSVFEIMNSALKNDEF